VDAPAHRWAATVVLLVALASLPTLAAVSAGSATLGETAGPDGTTPFIAQPSGLPAVIVPHRPVALPPTSATAAASTDYPAHRGGTAAAPRSPQRSPRPDGQAAGSAGRPPAAKPARPTCGRPTALGWRPLLSRPTTRDCAGVPR
jgi:hypothetical protein